MGGDDRSPAGLAGVGLWTEPIERSAASQSVDTRGHDEVVARKPANGVGGETDDEAAPGDLQFRMVVLRFGQQGDPRG